MCELKDEARTKMDRLIEAMNRLSSFFEKTNQDVLVRDSTSQNDIRAG